MRRHWVASFLVLLAVTSPGWTQPPGQLPDATNGKAIVSDIPGRASVSSQIQSPTDQPEQIPIVPITPAGPSVPSNITSPPQNHKPSLNDCHMGPPNQLYGQVSYLAWRMSDLPLPQVLATFNGAPSVGNGSVDFGTFNGGRFNAGIWMGCDHTRGFEVGGFILDEKSRSTVLSSNGTDLIARPFIDAQTDSAAQMVVAGPLIDPTTGLPLALIQGTFASAVTTQLGSLEGNFVRNLFYSCDWSCDAILGFRYISLEDDLRIVTQSQALGGATPFSVNNQTGFDHLTITDQFRTRNQFYAGQIGLRTEFRRGIWFGTLTGKVALGSNHQTSEIRGGTVGTNPAGGQVNADGGLLALPGGQFVVNNQGTLSQLPYANGGTFKTDWFTVAPEVGVQVGAQITRSIRAHVGYNFLYINNVVRPGDLIDTTLNRRYIPSDLNYNTVSGPTRPVLRTSRDDFIAYGVELGLQLIF